MKQNLYDEHPKTCAPDDFWGQVRRTINGKAPPQEQIDLIFFMIRQGLQLQPSDVLLDIACGNGKIGYELFNEVHAYLGVDLSPYLIEIAKKNFERSPTHTFLHKEAYTYCATEPHPECFTKALCFGSFSYFSPNEAYGTLSLLRERFPSLQRIFIAPIADKECANTFFHNKDQYILDDHTSDIGRWYTRENFRAMAEQHGWKADILPMPTSYYQAHYRFNVLLTPRK